MERGLSEVDFKRVEPTWRHLSGEYIYCSHPSGGKHPYGNHPPGKVKGFERTSRQPFWD